MCILDVTIIDLTSNLKPVIVKSRKALGYKRLEPKGAYVLKPFLLEDNLAQKRMFSLQVVDTDAFLEMPQTSQLLYFHLAMRADDDGFISNPKKIMKIIGSQDDDLKVLFSKRFIIGFKSGVIVIKHWNIHNTIQKDRYHETAYLDEKSQLLLKENNSYTECIQNGNSDKIRLDKNRLDKNSSKKFIPPTLEEVRKYINENKYNVNPDTFFNYFTTGNWIDSKGNKVKNWKQKIITWSSREKKPEPTSQLIITNVTSERKQRENNE